MKKMKILWIDDEITLLMPFIIFLNEKGYEVKTATNGSDGIEYILKEHFDLVLLDDMMIGLDGIGTLDEIKKINPSIHVIMCTKNEEEELMEKAIAGQISDYLIKPINPNQIIMSIKKIFQADEIQNNIIGEQYSNFIADMNRVISDNPRWNDWSKLYCDICNWDLKIDKLNDPNLAHTHFLEKRNCNTEFANYIENNYAEWLTKDERPNLSFDIVSQYVSPLLDEGKPVYYIIVDCMRLDQYLALEPFLKELFDIDLDLYYSILPTATPYSRNALFSGLLPIEIARNFPEYWRDTEESDNSRNRNEHQLLDEHLKDIGYNLQPSSKYVKIFNAEEANFVLRKIDSYKHENLVVFVYNFLDLLAHHRSRDQILLEAIPNEEAFRSFTKHWFIHSSFYEALKLISKQDAAVVLSTDHGSVKVNRATQVMGDRDTSVTVRYKEGRNLSCNPRHALYLKNPEEFGLPVKNIVENYIFAKDDYYFVYPNSYHQYQKQFNGTFQHGGISMEEMILPIAVMRSKNK
ncbi:MAG: response regulator [Candidatus Cloacimonadota bacterium]|nr:MAG: response regulator [Candidatus Cloacimonadota bacterium]